MEIQLFSGPNCKYCKMAKEFFNKHKIVFSEYDVTKEPAAKEKLLSYGARSIPLIVINNNPTLGFDEADITKKLTSAGWKK